LSAVAALLEGLKGCVPVPAALRHWQTDYVNWPGLRLAARPSHTASPCGAPASRCRLGHMMEQDPAARAERLTDRQGK